VATLASMASAALMLVVGLAPGQAMASGSGDQTVIARVTNPDGTVTETIYTPAPGVTPTELAGLLKGRGVAAKVEKEAVAAAVAPCGYGTANAWGSTTACFVRWTYAGAVRPIIDFVDYSGASWPVGRAVTRWNQVSGIDSIYRPSSSGCDGTPAHCVTVRSGNYGSGWLGQTTRTLNAAGTYYASAAVQLNDYYSGTETEKWSTSCHELGHVLGLNHNDSTGSCLYYQRVAGRSKYPNADDESLLELYY
jgi:hypothetical protein